MEEQGLLLKGVGGFYTVRTQAGELVECKARGRFRKDGITPLCGDRVTFLRQKEGLALLSEILPRRNVLVRPPVANITQLIIVLSAAKPKPDLMLLDKLLLCAGLLNIKPVIALNKCELAEESEILALQKAYEGCCEVLAVSAHTGLGIDVLSDRLGAEGETSCFAGQSAVGKSSLLNALLPGLDLPVGGLARKTDRGRHTTRHAQLWEYRQGYVLDTPGFSLLELPDPPPEQEEIDRAYPEFQDAPTLCRFAGCSHISEPDCGVKALLKEGRLSRARYERYVQLAQQMQEMRKHRYD